MSAQMFRQIEAFAEALMVAAEAGDEAAFYAGYEELEQFCRENEGSKRDHPVLWETLADFTEENPAAIALYQQAYQLADQQKETEYKASIQFSLAQRLSEEGCHTEAIQAVEKAEKFASYTEDDELIEEVALFKQQLAESLR